MIIMVSSFIESDTIFLFVVFLWHREDFLVYTLYEQDASNIMQSIYLEIIFNSIIISMRTAIRNTLPIKYNQSIEMTMKVISILQIIVYHFYCYRNCHWGQVKYEGSIISQFCCKSLDESIAYFSIQTFHITNTKRNANETDTYLENRATK